MKVSGIVPLECGEHEQFAKGLEDEFPGKVTKDGWFVESATRITDQQIALIVSKEIEDESNGKEL